MTGPSYTVKNIEAIAEGSDMRARLYTLAPGDVIPWHYSRAVHRGRDSRMAAERLHEADGRLHARARG